MPSLQSFSGGSRTFIGVCPKSPLSHAPSPPFAPRRPRHFFFYFFFFFGQKAFRPFSHPPSKVCMFFSPSLFPPTPTSFPYPFTLKPRLSAPRRVFPCSIWWSLQEERERVCNHGVPCSCARRIVRSVCCSRPGTRFLMCSACEGVDWVRRCQVKLGFEIGRGSLGRMGERVGVTRLCRCLCVACICYEVKLAPCDPSCLFACFFIRAREGLKDWRMWTREGAVAGWSFLRVLLLCLC